MHIRNLFSALALVLAFTLAISSNAAAEKKNVFPEVIPLPDGFQPEGIVVGRGPTFYVGSLADGAIYRGNLRTGEGSILVPGQDGRIAVGLDYDNRSGYLFVSGGVTGQAHVYDGETGSTIQVYQLAGENSFINDVIVTRDAAYFTNSFQPYLYRLPLGPGGSLPDPGDVETIALTAPWVQGDGFGANGIVASPNGKWLIVVHSTFGTLFRVDTDTGEVIQIDLGGEALVAGDGLLLAGKTLFVVQNRLNQIAVVVLQSDFTSGRVVDHITNPNFRVPTTIDKFGGALYAVNARFGTLPTPDTEYEVVRVEVR
jgi:sugar lactone lactonase YvrE